MERPRRSAPGNRQLFLLKGLRRALRERRRDAPPGPDPSTLPRPNALSPGPSRNSILSISIPSGQLSIRVGPFSPHTSRPSFSLSLRTRRRHHTTDAVARTSLFFSPTPRKSLGSCPLLIAPRRNFFSVVYPSPRFGGNIVCLCIIGLTIFRLIFFFILPLAPAVPERPRLPEPHTPSHPTIPLQLSVAATAPTPAGACPADQAS
jgi:hypothetical protein